MVCEGPFESDSGCCYAALDSARAGFLEDLFEAAFERGLDCYVDALVRGLHAVGAGDRVEFLRGFGEGVEDGDVAAELGDCFADC